jgi:hypothetical protein
MPSHLYRHNVINSIIKCKKGPTIVILAWMILSPLQCSSQQSPLRCSIPYAEATVVLKFNQGAIRRRGVIGGGVLFCLLFLTRKKVRRKKP